MADIELVIKIPEEIRLALINNIPLSIDQQSMCDSYIKHAIINSTPLPKGHGDLIDCRKLQNNIDDKDLKSPKDISKIQTLRKWINNQKPIIKADNVESEDE